MLQQDPSGIRPFPPSELSDKSLPLFLINKYQGSGCLVAFSSLWKTTKSPLLAICLLLFLFRNVLKYLTGDLRLTADVFNRKCLGYNIQSASYPILTAYLCLLAPLTDQFCSTMCFHHDISSSNTTKTWSKLP